MSALARFTSFDARRGSAHPGTGRPAALRRGRRPVFRFCLVALAATGAAAGALASAAALLAARPASADAPMSGPAGAQWSEIRRPLALFDLAGTEFSKLPSVHEARRRQPDGAREDVMTFGRLGDAKPYLQVSLLRAGPDGTGGDAGDGLADGLARLAAARGLTATRLHPAAGMDTRLGRFEAADLLLWGAAGPAPCLGFRGGGSVLRVSGFACGAPGHPMGRSALACAVDRIDLVSAGDDAALRAVFVAAERRDGATCLGGPSPAASLGGKAWGGKARGPGWLDPDGELPPLRGLFVATNRQR